MTEIVGNGDVHNIDVIVHNMEEQPEEAVPIKHPMIHHRSLSDGGKLWGVLRQEIEESDDFRAPRNMYSSWRSQGDLTKVRRSSRIADLASNKSFDQLQLPTEYPNDKGFHHKRVNSAQRRKDFAASVRRARAQSLANSCGSCNCHSNSSICSFQSVDFDNKHESLDSKHSMYSLPTKLNSSSRESRESGFSWSIDYTDGDTSPGVLCRRCKHSKEELPIRRTSSNVSLDSEHSRRTHRSHHKHKHKHKRKKRSSHSTSHSSQEVDSVDRHSNRHRHSLSPSRKHKSSHRHHHKKKTTYCSMCVESRCSDCYHETKDVYRPSKSLYNSCRSSFRRSYFDESEEHCHLQVTRNLSDPAVKSRHSKTKKHRLKRNSSCREISPLAKEDLRQKQHKELSDSPLSKPSPQITSRPPWVHGSDIEEGIREEISSHLKHLHEERQENSNGDQIPSSDQISDQDQNIEQNSIALVTQHEPPRAHGVEDQRQMTSDSAYESKNQSTERGSFIMSTSSNVSPLLNTHMDYIFSSASST